MATGNINQANLPSGFLPTLWSEAVLKYTERNFRLRSLITDFSSLVSGSGASVQVPMIGEETALSAPTDNSALTFEQGAESVVTINCDQHPYEAKRIEDIASVQASSDLFDSYAQSLGYAIAKKVDSSIATAMKDATGENVVALAGVSAGDDDSNITEAKLLEGMAHLWSKGIDPADGNTFMFCSPNAYKNLMTIPAFAHATLRGDQANPIVSGALGQIYGVPVYVSPDWDDSGASTTECATIFTRGSMGCAFSIEPRVQSQYNLEYIANDVVADCVFGVSVLDPTHIVNFTNE
tara:strand:- start:436 stop:1317 length:882 start_codon:yes stop_codon:yes gene_type:complete